MTEPTGTEPTTESIDVQIAELRQSEPFLAEFGHPLQRQVQKQIHDLYVKKHELSGGDGNEYAPPAGQNGNQGNLTFDPNASTVPLASPKEILEAAEKVGLDVSDLTEDNMDPARIQGLTILTAIEAGDLPTVSKHLSRAAHTAGLPKESIQYLREFTRKFAKPGDELSNAILRTIANHIYNTGKD